MKKNLKMWACIIFIMHVIQTKAQVNDAIQLRDALNAAGPGTVITFAPNVVIDLGDIPPEQFPLIVKPNVTIQGDYDLFINPNGTLITFPYMYQGGYDCDATNFSGGNNGTTQKMYEDDGTVMPDALIPIGLLFVFKMFDNSSINNIRLKGPKSDLKDYRFNLLLNSCDDKDILGSQLDGISSGIGVYGNNCEITNCEIYCFPFYGIERLPETVNNKGDFYLHNNYLHNNKGLGYGYGIYATGGDSFMTDIDMFGCAMHPPYSVANGRNSCTLDDNNHLRFNIFSDNATHIDGSGNRNSWFIDNSSFGSRFQNVAINRHNANGSTKVWTCNYSYPLGNGNRVITDVGGNVSSITDNTFFNGGGTIQINYPNCNDITSTCGNVYNNTGLVQINNNRFYDPGSNFGSTGQIKVGLVNMLNWDDPNDDHLYFGNSANSDENIFEENLTQVAKAQIISGSLCGNIRQLNLNSAEIYVGESLAFSSDGSIDANGNPGLAMQYHWRFHELSYDIEDLLVMPYTTFNGHSNSFCHQFNNIGITNVNLMAFDPSNYSASEFATHKVLVKPAIGDNNIYLVAHIMDTYAPRPLGPLAGCNHVADSRLPITYSTTGFKKFIRINGNEIWTEDIGDDNGGWERIQLNLSSIPNLLCTSQPGCTTTDMLEIGIRSEFPGVDAYDVRGVVLFVDDVYINTPDGKNALRNADFEKQIAAGSDWVALTPSTGVRDYPNPNFPPPCTLPMMPPTGVTLAGLISTGNSDWEIRSGNSSFKAYIKNYYKLSDGLPKTPGRSYYPGLHYPVGDFSGVRQSFNLQLPGYLRISSTTQNLSYSLQPNPSNEGTIVNGKIENFDNNKAYSLTVYSPQGNLIYSGPAQENFTVAHSFAPGVYYVKITNGTENGFKKLVVVK